MTEKLRQSLSAAMDDEADAFELRRVLDELGRDDELRSLWNRYHMIGSALRGDRLPVPGSLRERVWEALDVVSDAPPAAVEAAGVVETAEALAKTARSPSTLGRYTALAVAASVAFAVVLAFDGIWSGGEVPGANLAGSDTIATTGVTSQPAPGATAPQVDLGSEISPSDVQRAQAYMLHHTQQQALNQAGVMSFVKLATYEAP